MKFWEGLKNLTNSIDDGYEYDDSYDEYDDEDDDESCERISVWDAADIWLSNGMDEDYTFGYSEEELRDAL